MLILSLVLHLEINLVLFNNTFITRTVPNCGTEGLILEYHFRHVTASTINMFCITDSFLSSGNLPAQTLQLPHWVYLEKPEKQV